MARIFSKLARSSKIYDLATLEYEQATLGNMWEAKQKGNPFLFEEMARSFIWWQGHTVNVACSFFWWRRHEKINVFATPKNDFANPRNDLATKVVIDYSAGWQSHFKIWQGHKNQRTLPHVNMYLPHQKMTLPHFWWQGHRFVWQGHFKVWQGHIKLMLKTHKLCLKRVIGVCG